MNMKKISVIIPTHNREPFLKECIESVFDQTYNDFELIVVDDGSTDETEKLLESYSQRLLFIKQKQKGPSSARNLGIKKSKGDWITFLDSDDLWLPKKLEFQMNYFEEHKDAKISYTEEIWYRNGVRVNPHKKHEKHSGWIYQKMLPLCLVSPSSVMIHRSVLNKIGNFDETLLACEDYDLWLRIANLYPIYLIETPLIIKRNGHKEQQSQKFWGMDRFRIYSLIKLLKNNELSEKDKIATQKILHKKCKIFSNGCEKREKFEDANKYRSFIELYCK